MVWDIGAGSGSVAIEAAQLAQAGMVYAVEPEPSDIALIQANAEEFGVPNVKPVLGRAPEILETLPDPDAIFVGGTGRQLDLVLGSAFRAAVRGGEHGDQRRHDRGTLCCLPQVEVAGGKVRVWNVTIARGIEQMDRLRFESIAPTFLLVITKQVESED